MGNAIAKSWGPTPLTLNKAKQYVDEVSTNKRFAIVYMYLDEICVNEDQAATQVMLTYKEQWKGQYDSLAKWMLNAKSGDYFYGKKSVVICRRGRRSIKS